MLGEIKYGAISGKTRAMYGKLLKHDDYMALMQKKSVGEVVSYLKANTHYKAVLSDIEEDSVHRGQLENILRHDLVNDYGKLLKFSTGHSKDIINMLYVKIEIENLKLIFRAFESGRVSRPVLDNSLDFLASSGRVNISKLALSRSLNEFLTGLQGTVYDDVLRPFADDSNETRLFDMEMALDQFYLRNIQKNYGKLLTGADRLIMRELVGLESDIFNIFWIYRSKNYYHMDEKVIRTYTLPLIYKLTKKTMEALIHANNTEEYTGILKESDYRFLFEGSMELLVEHHYAEFLYKALKMRFRRYPFSIAGVTSYLRMKEIELSNIFTIAEGIRYGLPEGEIRKYVVGLDV